MELKTYLWILWRRRLIIGLTAAITLAVAGIGSKLMMPLYQASVKLHVATAASGILDAVEYDLLYTDRLMNTYLYIAQSGPVRTELQELFGLQELPSIDAQILVNTALIELTVEAKDARLASDLANTLAEIVVQRSEQLVNADLEKKRQTLKEQLDQFERELVAAQDEYQQLSAQTAANEGDLAAIRQEIDQKRQEYVALLSQYEALRTRAVIQTNLLSIMEPAIPPLAPARPNLPLNLALGLVLGLATGLGLALLAENFDSRLHSIEQIETVTQLPMLARIPVAHQAQWPDIIMNSHSVHEEVFARLATSLAAQAATTSSLIVLVTSAEPGEGKSTVVANLATALGKMGCSVTAIDCNLYHPSLDTIFRLSNEIGLTDIIVKRMNLNQAIQPTLIPNLRVIPSGEQQGHPGELFTPTRLEALVTQLRARGGMILLDAPACLSAVDTLALSTIADGIVFVVGQSIAHEEAVKRARRELVTMAGRLMGVVVTRTTQSLVYPYKRG
jgi:non-specific protein-tyrosine kinase